MRSLYRWARTRYLATRDRGLVLLYHRIRRPEGDPQLLCVSPENFVDHLKVLGEWFRPTGLSDLTAALRERRVPHRSVAVTFDDGYRDNFETAQPLLETLGVPATVYVASDFVDGGREFYWDELEQALLLSHPLPASMRIQASGRVEDLRFVSERHPGAGHRERPWNVTMPAESPRHEAYLKLCAWLHGSDQPTREEILSQVFEQAGVARMVRKTHRTASAADLRAAARSETLQVGGHTASHVSLARLPGDLQRAEIVSGKARLEAILGVPVTSFSYPYGKGDDFDATTVALVREAGYENAVANQSGVVWWRTDRFAIPRMVVRDWSRSEFERRLREWFLE